MPPNFFAKPSKKQWLDWHSLLGITTGLMLFIICWTGTFATVSLELDWLFNQAVGSPTSTVDHNDLLNAYNVVKEAHPDSKILGVNKLGTSLYSISVSYKEVGGGVKLDFFDPQTQKIKGSTSTLTISRFFRDFHMNLFGFYGIGKYLVCVFSIMLMGSLFSILFFYKPLPKRFFERPTTSTPRAFWGSIHRLLGLWSIWFLFLIGITGAWYLFEQTRIDMLDNKFSYTDTFSSGVNQLPEASKGESLSLKQLTNNALSAIPELEIASITLDRGGYVYFIGQTEQSFLVRNRANKIYVDSVSGSVMYAQRSSDLSAYWYWSNMADPLHFGDFGGWITKTLWVVFGFILCFLSLSGTWMYVKRLSKKPERINKSLLKKSVITSLTIGGLTLIMAGLRINYLHQKSPLDMPIPVFIFLILWTLLTCFICIFWGRWLMGVCKPVKGA